MTKMKNTKKGMAKKALSISLVAAMLATSNVPVWAAFEADDATPIVVEAPVAEAPVMEEIAPVAEVPVAEEPGIEAFANEAYSAEIKLSAASQEWGSNTVKATVTLKDLGVDGAIDSTDQLYYVWLGKDGRQFATSRETQITTAVTEVDLPTTTRNDFLNGETLTLYVYSKESGVDFEAKSSAVSLTAKDISETVEMELSVNTVEYTGRDTKTTPRITYTGKPADCSFNIAYVGDTVNVTDEGVIVRATASTPGYVGTLEEVYKITPVTISPANANVAQWVKAEMVTNAFTYTGNRITIANSDVKLTNIKTGEDITNLVSAVTTTATNVAKNNSATIKLATNSANKNFIISGNVTLEGKYDIVARDLSTVNVEIPPITLLASNAAIANSIKANAVFTDEDGNVLNLKNAIQITMPTDAIKTEGTYEITISPAAGNTNVINSMNTTVTVVTHNLATAELMLGSSAVSNLATKTYDSTEQTQDLSRYTLTYNSTKLIENVDYTVSYEKNVNAGTAYVVFTGIGRYAGVKKIPFTINPATVNSISAERLVFHSEYTKADQYADAMTIKVTANAGKLVLEQGKDFTVESYAFDTSNVRNGRVVATIKYSDNFNDNGKITVSAILGGKQLQDSFIELQKTSYEYTGSVIKPDFVVMDGTTELKEGTDYKIVYTTNLTEVGEAILRIVGVGEYDGSIAAEAKFEITPAQVESVEVLVEAPTYDGNQQKVQPVIKLNGNVVTSQFDLAWGENINAGKEAGSVTVTPKTGNKNFVAGSKTQTFEIKPFEITGTFGTLTAYNEKGLKVNIATTKFDYDGTPHEFASVDFTPTASILNPSGAGTNRKWTENDYEIIYKDNIYGKNVSTTATAIQKGAVLVVVKGNYICAGTYEDAEKVVTENVVKTQQFTINTSTFVRKEITVSNPEYAEFVSVKPVVTVKDGDRVLTEGVDYKLVLRGGTTYNAVTTKDIYEVNVVGINAYANSKTETFTWGIDPKDLENTTITAATDKNGEVKVTVNNGVVTVSEKEYIVVKNDDNTITVTAKADSKNYTGSKTVAIDGKELQAPTVSATVDRNMVNVSLDAAIEGAESYDYALCQSTVDIEEPNFFKSKMSVDATTTQFQFVREGQYYVYARAAKRDENGKKVVSDWSVAAIVNITCDTPNAPTVTKVTTSGNTVTVTYTTGARTEGVDVMLGGAVRKQLEDDAMRPVNYNSKTGLIKNVPATTKTVTFTNVAKGTYFVGVHPYITSNDGLKYFGRWSKQTGITKVVVG